MPEAALPMHQHISMFSLVLSFLLILTKIEVTSSVLKNVTIGIGACIHILYAYARVVKGRVYFSHFCVYFKLEHKIKQAFDYG